jgi:hypothetical protein
MPLRGRPGSRLAPGNETGASGISDSLKPFLFPGTGQGMAGALRGPGVAALPLPAVRWYS